VITPLDPNEGNRYNENVNEDAQSSIIENIYQITRHKEYYINPLADGELSWRSVKSYDVNSKDAMEIRKNKLNEVSTRICAQITTMACKDEFGGHFHCLYTTHL
jgi:hypothetical protein